MKNWQLRSFILTVFTLIFMVLFSSSVSAQEGEVLGIHILHPGELSEAKLLVGEGDTENWQYVTIPLTLNDLEKASEWQAFFDEAKKHKMIPLVRLTTKFEGENWKVPTRDETLSLLQFLQKLDWPTEQRHIIVFNEVNHAKEWGGTLDPAGYAQTLRFVSIWADAQVEEFVVLPAAMDLAAPNGKVTMEAFTYLDRMFEADPDVLSLVDHWNSHSYPNPGFSSSPERQTKDSLRGFKHELEYLKEKTNQDMTVFITETGWSSNRLTTRWLESYYTYALQHIWSDPQVVAVTPFLLKGDPGPFQSFTFIDKNNKPTPQYTAVQKALSKLREN